MMYGLYMPYYKMQGRMYSRCISVTEKKKWGQLSQLALWKEGVYTEKFKKKCVIIVSCNQ